MRPILTAFAILACLSPLPAFAGAAETALLAQYAGVWSGKGEITGPDAGKVSCKLTMKATSAGKLVYNGRCSLGTVAAGFNGTMQYSDANRRYEAITSARGQTTTTIGKPQGGNVVFTSSTTDDRYGTISSTIALGKEAITLSFKAKAVGGNGENASSQMVLTRQ